VAAAFSPEATGAAMRARLERLVATAPVASPGPAVRSQALQDLRDKHAYDRGEGSPGVAQTTGGKALRAVRPYTFHQRDLNGRVLKALEEQAQRIDELEEQLRRARLGIADARGATGRDLHGQPRVCWAHSLGWLPLITLPCVV